MCVQKVAGASPARWGKEGPTLSRGQCFCFCVTLLSQDQPLVDARGETGAAAARRLGCCAFVVQHGHHCCRSHIISRIFSLCVRDLSCVANPVALTRVDLTTRLDLHSSWSWLVVSCFIDVARSVIVVFKCASIAPNLPCPSLHIIMSWLRRGFGLHFVEFCLSRGPVAGRRHHCIRVPFDPPRLLNCACRGFLQRRAPPLPIIETQKSPCGAMWTDAFHLVSFLEKEKCCFVFYFITAIQKVSL